LCQWNNGGVRNIITGNNNGTSVAASMEQVTIICGSSGNGWALFVVVSGSKSASGSGTTSDDTVIAVEKYIFVEYITMLSVGHAIAQAVSLWLPTSAAWVQTRV
jgi:hypothetical protein